MSFRDWRFRVQDIINSIDRIILYTDGKTLSTFKKDQMAVDAVVRNFEIIGEACAYIPQAIQKKIPRCSLEKNEGNEKSSYS